MSMASENEISSMRALVIGARINYYFDQVSGAAMMFFSALIVYSSVQAGNIGFFSLLVLAGMLYFVYNKAATIWQSKLLFLASKVVYNAMLDGASASRAFKRVKHDGVRQILQNLFDRMLNDE